MSRLVCFWLLGVIALCSNTFTAGAHNPDTSYTRIKLSAEGLEFKFTFDIITLLKIVDLDGNRDHQVTREEVLQKAPAIYEFLRRTVTLEVDGAKADFGETGPVAISENLTVVPEKDYHQTLVHFVFRKPLPKLPEEFTLIYDFFVELGDRHTNLAAIEHGTHREEEIVFTRFEPDYTYYTDVESPLSGQLAQFLKLGVGHIFLGYDHILFLLALIVVSRLKELIKIITAFTVAHTITLILAALEVVKLPPRLIETGIAVTIMYVALENLWAKKTSHRWVLTFFFGLVHGFGFANVLREMGLPTTGLVRSLVSFNVGVELGQLAIVLAALPFSLWLGRQRFGAKGKNGLSAVIFLFGLAWFVERAFRLQFMPI